ncbi:unnamed protein product [Caenorhabditis angaria]|uniref:Peptidase M13 N-terminal domain-containing protein n=1 Tax=Caenorhabditis angaria TaxID=860376 RepID=A0A9P1N3Z1_9PELO|nr:unnamed protein product [Caenorhabditis angaria]
MFQFLTIFLFFSTTFALKYDILKVLEDNIDENIEPCDNFYRHVCKKRQPNLTNPTITEHLNKIYYNDLLELEKNVIPFKLQRLVHLTRYLAWNPNITMMFEHELKSLYIQRCENDKPEALEFLKLLQEFFRS